MRNTGLVIAADMGNSNAAGTAPYCSTRKKFAEPRTWPEADVRPAGSRRNAASTKQPFAQIAAIGSNEPILTDAALWMNDGYSQDVLYHAFD